MLRRGQRVTRGKARRAQAVTAAPRPGTPESGARRNGGLFFFSTDATSAAGHDCIMGRCGSNNRCCATDGFHCPNNDWCCSGNCSDGDCAPATN